MPKSFEPASIEEGILERWLEGGYYAQAPVGDDTETYSIVIPPPNVTGSLHMGHALNNTLQDVLIRRSRMKGTPTRWVVGTDHAGIATQNKVEQKLAGEGLTRFDVGRDRFVEMCWEWRAEHGSTIINQLKQMGCSCDFDNEQFTMDPGYQKAVRKVFVDWYNRGLIYRGNRIINWCPRCTTALSDIEVEHKDDHGHLWYVKYPLKAPVDDITHVTVATSRPETILGDVAVAVHPEDERYTDLVGATVILPLMDREIPIIADEYVDPTFGSGMVKITPAHDPNDYEVGVRHDLPRINVMTGEGTMSAEAGEMFEGLDRYDARAKVVAELEGLGLLDHTEEQDRAVGHCYRCDSVIEPWLSDQWFVAMKDLAAPAIEAVRDGSVTFHPKRWENVYFQWMENIHDWTISRQLWWGHRIPVYYCETCGWQGAEIDDIDECPVCFAEVRQDEDVLDTWFSSQLWPFAALGWPEETDDLKSFYPTDVLSTARDILFLWVARMVVCGLDFLDEIPFTDVIIHPTVLDAKGDRMSKSKGNGIDPLDLIDKFGTDATRFGLVLQVTGAQDMKFMEGKLESSRHFANKIWNAARFVEMNLEGYVPGEPSADDPVDAWILSRLASVTASVDRELDALEFGDAARDLYEFLWNEYCDWYIEFSKSRLAAGGEARAVAQRNLAFVLDHALRLLHPMMPFITEEIWRQLPHGGDAASIMIAEWPDADELARYIDADAVAAIDAVRAVVGAVRGARARYGISPREALAVSVRGPEAAVASIRDNESLVASLGNLSALAADSDVEKPADSTMTVAGGLEIFVVLAGLVDFDAERVRLEKDRASSAADLEKLQRKLGNEGFLAKAAPEIIEKDRSRAAELSERIGVIDRQLAELG